MRYLLVLIILSVVPAARSADWIQGKWEGFCTMSVSAEEGSLIWNYTFLDGKGSLESQSYKDNRCQKLESTQVPPFKFKAVVTDPNQIQIDIKFDTPETGKDTRVIYAFDKYSSQRMGLNAIYLVQRLGKNGKIEDFVKSKEGVTKFSTLSFSRSTK